MNARAGVCEYGADIAAAGALTLVDATSSCFHCGLPVATPGAYQVRFDGAMRAMCCVGCEAVARTIIDGGLEAYYRQRTGPSLVPVTSTIFAGDRAIVASSVERVTADIGIVSLEALREAALTIDGITCGACAWLAEAALARVPGVIRAHVHPVTHRATVSWDASRTDLSTLMQALHNVGLAGTTAQTGAEAFVQAAARKCKRRQQLIELGIALLGMMQVMMFTVPLYFAAPDDVSAEARALMGWAGLVLTLPVLIVSARPFFIGAWRDIRIVRVSMDLPVSLAIAAIFATSSISLLSNGNDVYFDSISMFVFLLLAARYLESSARESALQWIERLTNAAPAIASRIPGFPQHRECETVAAAALGVGNVIRIANGEAAAADGEIIEGKSTFDESLLTGESQPVPRGIGSSIVGGAINLGAPVWIRVARTGDASFVANLRRLTEQALAARPAFGELADRVARYVAPLTLLFAAVAAISWWFIDPAMSFPVAIAVLAVTCPCALALAAPAAHVIAVTRLARDGVLVTRSGALEKIAAATDIVFDKTGTLTEGVPTVASVDCLGNRDVDEVLALAIALEEGSIHPVARALKNHAGGAGKLPPKMAVQLVVIPGSGVAGDCDGLPLRLGNRAFVGTLAGCPLPANVPPDATVFLAERGQWLAAISLTDALRPDALATLNSLRDSGLTTHLVSGDRTDRVAATAATLGLFCAGSHNAVRAAQTPQQKLAFADTMNRQGKNWIAVGDGVNDAPAMAAASVSIAIGTGADLTRLTADAVLLSPYLTPLATTLHVARTMRRVIAQNFAWAIAYNIVAVPLALTGAVNPAWAAIGMATSSLVVVANSLRLSRIRVPQWKS